MIPFLFRTNETWLVCGGRDFNNRRDLEVALSGLANQFGWPDCLIHGDARGADSMAAGWAKTHGIRVIAVPADWKAHGTAAGSIRNQAMLNDYRPHRVIAFPGGNGTADMMRRAAKVTWACWIDVEPKPLPA